MPAIVSVVLRAAPLFALTVTLTAPFPDPLAPLVIEIHEASFVADHAHPAPAVTATLPVPPAAGNDWLAGAIVKLHEAAGCEMVAVAVPI